MTGQVENEADLMKTIVQVQQAFQRIPGVGPSIGADLVDLGVRGLDDLAGRCPEALYRDLIDLRRAEIDRCVLYVDMRH